MTHAEHWTKKKKQKNKCGDVIFDSLNIVCLFVNRLESKWMGVIKCLYNFQILT